MKFRIYDKVWILLGSEAKEYIVYERREEASRLGPTNSYYIVAKSHDGMLKDSIKLHEGALFTTKQELFKSIQYKECMK